MTKTTQLDDIAAKMRRMLREAKALKAFKEVAQDKPRSEFWGRPPRDRLRHARRDPELSAESGVGCEAVDRPGARSLALLCANSRHWTIAQNRIFCSGLASPPVSPFPTVG